jgi:hypothetical protein
MTRRLAPLSSLFLAVLAASATAMTDPPQQIPTAAAQPVFLNALVADRPVEPTELRPDSDFKRWTPPDDYLRNLQWSSWGGPEATGTGEVRPAPRGQSSAVSVTLGGLTTCGGPRIYTSYSLTLQPGASTPEFWPDGERASFPCRLNAGRFYPSAPGEAKRYREGGCVMLGGIWPASNGGSDLPAASRVITSKPTVWSPPLPHGPLGGFCRTRWSGWGRAQATGLGVLRNGFEQWGVTAVVSAPRWCRHLGISYTHMVMTRYGAGEPIPPRGAVTKRDAARLVSHIDKRGFAPHVTRQVQSPAYDCTG